MLIDRCLVTAALREQGQHDRAQHADCALPRCVDTQRDAGLLHQFDLQLDDLLDAVGSSA